MTEDDLRRVEAARNSVKGVAGAIVSAAEVRFLCSLAERLNIVDKELAEARAEAEQLRVIVDRLPKTADGKPIAVGMP